MVPWLGPMAFMAANRQLVTIWLVSTLPATTAAGIGGLQHRAVRMTMSIGFRQPAFMGIGSLTITRNTYSVAARVTGSGALKLLPCSVEVAGEVDAGAAGLRGRR